jgi:hypothetical protein
MKRSLILLCCLLFGGFSSMAQTLSGTFAAQANQTITLEGAKGLATYSIGSTKADEKGQFTLSFAAADYGVAFLS